MPLSFAPSGSSARRFDTGTCRASLWFPAPRVVAARLTGAIDGMMTRDVYAAVDEHWASQGPQTDGFIDLGDVEDVDFEARTVALRWNLAHRAYIQRLYLLVQSPVVHLAARVFSFAFPEMMRVHGERAAFETEYALVVTRRTARTRTSQPPAARG